MPQYQICVMPVTGNAFQKRRSELPFVLALSTVTLSSTSNGLWQLIRQTRTCWNTPEVTRTLSCSFHTHKKLKRTAEMSCSAIQGHAAHNAYNQIQCVFALHRCVTTVVVLYQKTALIKLKSPANDQAFVSSYPAHLVTQQICNKKDIPFAWNVVW